MTTVYYYYYTFQSDEVYESRAGVDGLGVSNEYIMWYQHAWVSLGLLRGLLHTTQTVSQSNECLR